MTVIECNIHGAVEGVHDRMYKVWCHLCREELVHQAIAKIAPEDLVPPSEPYSMGCSASEASLEDPE